jgi:hypothetical protein
MSRTGKETVLIPQLVTYGPASGEVVFNVGESELR